ncbi:prepilin peptidase, partial [Candidatus Hydrogenedentota bacterium]
MDLFIGIVIFIFGSMIGSFLNVCIWRMPRDESLIKPGSHCPKCNEAIPFYLNIPIFSYVILRGKCANCGVSISPIYPAVEALNGLIWLAVYWRYGVGGPFLLYALVVSSLVVVTFIDLKHYIIPNEVTYFGVIGGLGVAVFITILPKYNTGFLVDGIVPSLLGALLGAGLIYGT